MPNPASVAVFLLPKLAGYVCARAQFAALAVAAAAAAAAGVVVAAAAAVLTVADVELPVESLANIEALMQHFAGAYAEALDAQAYW